MKKRVKEGIQFIAAVVAISATVVSGGYYGITYLKAEGAQEYEQEMINRTAIATKKDVDSLKDDVEEVAHSVEKLSIKTESILNIIQKQNMSEERAITESNKNASY